MISVTSLFGIAVLALFCSPVQPATLCRCGDPKLGKHLKIIPSSATTNVGQKLQLECDNDYDLTGPPEIRCTTSGWTEIPFCKEKLTCAAIQKDIAARNESRTDCGYPGIPMLECLDRGCCWDSSIYNINWCFFHDQHDYSIRSVAQCNVRSNYPLVNCGFDGIREKDCASRGCCFDNVKKFCFFAAGDVH